MKFPRTVVLQSGKIKRLEDVSSQEDLIIKCEMLRKKHTLPVFVYFLDDPTKYVLSLKLKEARPTLVSKKDNKGNIGIGIINSES